MQKQAAITIIPILNHRKGCSRCSDKGNRTDEPMQSLRCRADTRLAEMSECACLSLKTNAEGDDTATRSRSIRFTRLFFGLGYAKV